LPSWIQIRIRIANPDPDPGTPLNPDPQHCLQVLYFAPIPPLEGVKGWWEAAIFIYSSVVYGTSFVDHKLGRGRVLADAGAAHIAGVGEPSVQDDELVDALVELLDLDAVVLGEDLAGHLPLGHCLVVAHLALEDDLVLLLAGLALQLLQAVTVLAKIKI
jgi:hypothetical protein